MLWPIMLVSSAWSAYMPSGHGIMHSADQGAVCFAYCAHLLLCALHLFIAATVVVAVIITITVAVLVAIRAILLAALLLLGGGQNLKSGCCRCCCDL